MVDTSKRVPTKSTDRVKTEADDSKKPVTGAKTRAQRSANEAAHKAAKTQQEYEKDQTTISK
jgi:hypothetical protein